MKVASYSFSINTCCINTKPRKIVKMLRYAIDHEKIHIFFCESAGEFNCGYELHELISLMVFDG